ncbi:MAG: hypothetical protein JW845_05330 [Dehalococcoidales bacterium]|nr:hypothetical protein [Dehalococcoidales bacterium]
MEIKFTSKPYMPTLITSLLLLFTAIFLPWGVAGVASVNGVADWGAMATIAAILGVCLSFLTSAKIRAIGLMVVGVLALIGAIIFITRLNNTGLSISYGIIFELIISLVAVYIGFQDFSKSNPAS